MDKETKEYLDRKFLGLVARDDVEKLRQETKANFRQLKEESRVQIEKAREESNADMDRLKEEWTRRMDPLLEEIRRGLQGLKGEGPALLEQSSQVIELSLERMGEEARAAFDRAKQQMSFILESMKEGQERSRISERGAREDLDHLRKGVEGLQEQIRQATKEVAALSQRGREGFIEMKEEFGAMMKFSFADLEKKINALESRIKALEKMVFH